MKSAWYIIVIIIVVVAMTTIAKDILHHFKDIKKLEKASLMYKAFLLLVGLFILTNKVLFFLK